MNEKTITAINEAWAHTPLRTRYIIIIETQLFISMFHGEMTDENCDEAHKIAVQMADRLIEENGL
jgi:hypothetical protein